MRKEDRGDPETRRGVLNLRWGVGTVFGGGQMSL